MRASIIAVLIFVSLVSVAHADVILKNDSSSIDFTNDGTTPDSDEDPLPDGDDSGSGGFPDDDEDGFVDGGGNSGGGGGGSTTPVVTQVIIETENASSGGVEEETASASDVLGTLVGNQAVSVAGGVYSEGGGEDGDTSVSIRGSKVRSSLGARGIKKLSVPGFGFFGRPSGSALARTREDFAIVAAGTALSNTAIDEISLMARTLHISYRARGNLFAFIPMTYRIRMEVNPDETALAARTKVRFPWYKFFLRTYVSRGILQKDISALVDGIPKDAALIDQRARLTVAISQLLQARFDTVDSSVSTN